MYRSCAVGIWRALALFVCLETRTAVARLSRMDEMNATGHFGHRHCHCLKVLHYQQSLSLPDWEECHVVPLAVVTKVSHAAARVVVFWRPVLCTHKLFAYYWVCIERQTSCKPFELLANVLTWQIDGVQSAICRRMTCTEWSKHSPSLSSTQAGTSVRL